MKALCSFALAALLSVLPALCGTVPLSGTPAALFDDTENVSVRFSADPWVLLML